VTSSTWLYASKAPADDMRDEIRFDMASYPRQQSRP
jgi:hypothetical protein